MYYIYHRQGMTDYTLSGPYNTIESAKKAFLVTIKETFDFSGLIERTYEPYEEFEEVEKVIDELETEAILA
ncbi:hypothetical protein BGZ70_005237 [Mortierella alpina]|uniref:Uncharacterized protein n=1 Tax=Mortierella alpina TaxID=64518 RepID=A0A9P6LUJ7_MORAP|nr:hypothetical protein BGZ70_005237 [Mortierella alpina]